MSTGAIKISPSDQGRGMTIAEFEASDFEEGYLYELGRGRLVVSDVPNPPHLRRVEHLRDELAFYRRSNPGVVDTIAGGGECRLVISGFDSVRHPDLAVYRTPAPSDSSDVWETWVPDFVVEVVSPGSQMRDYQEKRDEYLAFGVKEYWVINQDKAEVLQLRRVGGRWREARLQAGQVVKSSILPGFECDCNKLLGV